MNVATTLPLEEKPCKHSATSRQTRVLHVINNLDVGGAEKRLLDVTRDVNSDSIKLHFCTLSGRSGALDREFENAGATLHILQMGIFFSYHFKRLLREFSFDVVHAHMHYSAGYVLRLASQVNTARRVAHFRSCKDGREDNLRRRLQRRVLRRWINNYATDIVACGKTAMQSNWGLRWASDARCKIVYNGVDPAMFNCPCARSDVNKEFDLGAEGPLFIHIGNLRVPKNHKKLLEVFAHIKKRTPTANLLLVGRGNNALDHEIRSLAVEHGISNSVVFTGQRNDVPRLLSAADVMIFPSLWEGLPGAVLEACASGVPVLASDLPEIREISRHLPSVQCLPLTMNHQQWADAALSLVSESLAQKRTESIREDFQRSPFHINHSVRQLCEIWSTTKVDESHINRRGAA